MKKKKHVVIDDFIVSLAIWQLIAWRDINSINIIIIKHLNLIN